MPVLIDSQEGTATTPAAGHLVFEGITAGVVIFVAGTLSLAESQSASLAYRGLADVDLESGDSESWLARLTSSLEAMEGDGGEFPAPNRVACVAAERALLIAHSLGHRPWTMARLAEGGVSITFPRRAGIGLVEFRNDGSVCAAAYADSGHVDTQAFGRRDSELRHAVEWSIGEQGS